MNENTTSLQSGSDSEWTVVGAPLAQLLQNLYLLLLEPCRTEQCHWHWDQTSWAAFVFLT